MEFELPILDYFFEIECPFCRRVRIYILDKLRTKQVVIINPIDVDANLGCREMDWYNNFCKGIHSEPTPLLRLHDNLTEEDNWEFVFVMWRKKPTTLTEDVLSSEEYLEKQIYDKIRYVGKTLVVEVQPSYELERDMFLSRRGMGLDARVH